jgi:hypothetical protein
MRGSYAEAQRSVSDLLGHSSVDHETRTEEHDGDPRRADRDEHELDSADGPRTGRERVKFQE